MFLISNISFYYKRKILPGFKTSEKSLTLDIGSGDKPFWRADFFVDDLSLGDVQRASESRTIHDIGEFVDANVVKMPFKDKVFDFSFCCHLLEHVDDPAAAIKEITRVSKAGYIEIPNGIIETVQPFVSHIWFIYRNGNKLIFVRKSKRMHEILSKNGKVNIDMIVKAKEPFIRLYWKNKIEYEVIDNLKESEKYHSPTRFKKKKDSPALNYHMLFVHIMRFLFYKKKNIKKSVYKK
ncbi:MAG TPA: class I SAM-dependent methyltransferase [Patescibacteria group bacterium]|nr:class I SAM-dependent methyltransferase [Patescibacteria group bacterium]